MKTTSLLVHLAQLNFTIGDLDGNRKLIRTNYSINSGSADIVVYSELALTGYPPNDLLLRKNFVEAQSVILEEIRYWTEDLSAALMIGCVTKGDKGQLYNSVVCFQNGQEIFRYHKQLLPTYNIFDEQRYFEAGAPDQKNVFTLKKKDGTECEVGVLICEDAWNDEAVTKVPRYPTNPFKNLAAQNPDIIITVNASPSHVMKFAERYSMYCRLAKIYKTSIVYVNQVGANDSLIFDGGSFVAYYDKNYGTTQPIKMNTFVEHSKTIEVLDSKEYPLEAFNNVWKEIPHDKAEQRFHHLVLGLQDYCAKNGFKTVVIGESGGIDSAVVTAIAVEALGSNNVKAITMPSKVSSRESVDDSEVLCNNLNIHLFNYPIKEQVETKINNFANVFGQAPMRLTVENIQPRERAEVLMAYSNQTGALVLSTGNKSEMSVGYCTLYGDMCGGLSVIGDVYKMEVYHIASFYNKLHGANFIPDNIISKAPSAELWEGQKDTDSLPPYPILDAILKLYLEGDLMPEEEIKECRERCEQVTLAEIKRIVQLVDRAEFKRKQAPPILRVRYRSFGFGRNLPITQKFATDYRSVL